MIFHQPVLVAEIIKLVQPQPNDLIIDGTLGHGGHTKEFLAAGAKVIGFDLDPQSITTTRSRIPDKNLVTVNQNFSEIPDFLIKNNLQPKAILLDLGLNIDQYKSGQRGFSFQSEQPLDMRINPVSQTLTAEEIINTWPQEKLFEIFSKFTQEILSPVIAREIVAARKQLPFTSARQLAEFVQNIYYRHHKKSKIHPATKIFLALRIVTNSEISHLSEFLQQSLLLSQVQVLIISFHSTEDRLIKKFINNNFVNSPPPIYPSPAEVRHNPLSRSAVLRSYTIR